jgi:hypothetical protein
MGEGTPAADQPPSAWLPVAPTALQ